MGCSVLVVDDHAPFRAVVSRLLEAAGFVVVGEAVDGASALAIARQVRPSVALVDIQLPDINGFDLTELLVDGPHPPRVVLTSTRAVSDYGSRMSKSRARGFIAKSELSGSALRALCDRGV